MNKPILVTGAHRSGTTWVGRMLSLSPKVGYIHEPFNPLHRVMSPGICKAKFKYQYTYVTEENESEYFDDIRRVTEFRYNLFLQLREVIRKKEGIRTLANLYGGFLVNRYVHDARPLFKDPMALLSVDWLATRFDMDVVILIRHPAAFISSIKRMDWWEPHDFSQFLKQPLLMRDHLNLFEDELNKCTENKFDVIDGGILLWKIFYLMVNKYQSNGNDYLYLRHEDLAQKPGEQFRVLFDRLKIDYTSKIEKEIVEHTRSSNPAEAPGSVMHLLKRDSAELARIWKSRLSKSEIERIRVGVGSLCNEFYSDSDW